MQILVLLIFMIDLITLHCEATSSTSSTSESNFTTTQTGASSTSNITDNTTTSTNVPPTSTGSTALPWHKDIYYCLLFKQNGELKYEVFIPVAALVFLVILEFILIIICCFRKRQNIVVGDHFPLNESYDSAYNSPKHVSTDRGDLYTVVDKTFGSSSNARTSFASKTEDETKILG